MGGRSTDARADDNVQRPRTVDARARSARDCEGTKARARQPTAGCRAPTERHELAATADRRRMLNQNSPEFERQSSNDVRSDSVGGSEKQRRRGRPPTSLPPAPDRSTKPRFISSASPSDGPARKPSPHEHVRPAPARSFLRVPTPRRSSGSSTPQARPPLARVLRARRGGVLARGEGCRTVQRGGHGFAVRVSRGGWPHGVAEVRAPARVPVGYSHVQRSRSGGAPGVSLVCVKTRLPVG